MLFGLGLAGAGGMLLIWLALKFKRIKLFFHLQGAG